MALRVTAVQVRAAADDTGNTARVTAVQVRAAADDTGNKLQVTTVMVRVAMRLGGDHIGGFQPGINTVF